MSQQTLRCTPPPPPKKNTIQGGFIFFDWVLVPPKLVPQRKMDFVRDIGIRTHKNVVIRHNHSNPISTNLTIINNNE